MRVVPSGAPTVRAAMASYAAMNGLGRNSACGSIVSVVLRGAPAAPVISVVALVPLTVVCSDETWPRIEATGKFGITVLAEDQHETSGRFASKVEDKFAGETWEPAPITGSPLIQGGLEHIDCTLHDVLDGGDHVIVLGRVTYLDVHREDTGPLLFYKGKLGGYHLHD